MMMSPTASGSLSPRTLNLDVVRKMHTEICLWFLFFTFVFVIYYAFSDGDFSFLMTYAALGRSFGFAILLARIFIKGHGKGVSLKTLWLYVFVFGSRLLSILRHEGYLPYDKSGDFVYHSTEILSLLLALSCLLFIQLKCPKSYQQKYDSFGSFQSSSFLGTLYLIVPCLLLALVLHPTLNSDFVSDVAWTFSMYMETCAIIPQLYMFQCSTANKGVVEVMVSHSVFALGFARVLDMVFWLYSYHELTGAAGSKMAGTLVLISQFVHIAIMADFYYYYFLSIKNGKMMQLPVNHSNMA